jgi:hypothetical protein
VNQQVDLGSIARDIIDANLYMVLGTADESGWSWVSPVYFTPSKYNETHPCHFERQREILRNRKKISQSLALLRNDKLRVMADYFPSPKSVPSV